MILVRHGESEFNVAFTRTRVDPGIHDPRLTDIGRQQAINAAKVLAGYDIERIIASPYTRALETASVIAEELSLPVEVEPMVRERGFFACDIGTPKSRLAERWPHHDFDGMDEIWWQEGESEAALAARCEVFRRAIVAHSHWPRIAIVAHWGFIRALTGVPLGNGEIITYTPPA